MSEAEPANRRKEISQSAIVHLRNGDKFRNHRIKIRQPLVIDWKIPLHGQCSDHITPRLKVAVHGVKIGKQPQMVRVWVQLEGSCGFGQRAATFTSQHQQFRNCRRASACFGLRPTDRACTSAASKNRREGDLPYPLRRPPDGRGCRAARSIPAHPRHDRRFATTRASTMLTTGSGRAKQATGERRPHRGEVSENRTTGARHRGLNAVLRRRTLSRRASGLQEEQSWATPTSLCGKWTAYLEKVGLLFTFLLRK